MNRLADIVFKIAFHIWFIRQCLNDWLRRRKKKAQK